jgi:two-component system, chemotaxis family, chemotaxis protein CheY
MKKAQKTILIVDEKPGIRKMVSFTLKKAGYYIMEAENSKEALSLLNTFLVDLIILDLDMPNVEAVEFIKKVRDNPVYTIIPILMLMDGYHIQIKDGDKSAFASDDLLRLFEPNVN